MQTQILNEDKVKVGELELSDDVFAVPLKKALISQMVLKQLANKRVGSASTKTRGDVKCSNKKPYRQKGTGRARHGSYASPLFVGGGVAFGPKPRSYSFELPTKARRLALKSVVSMKFRAGKVFILDKLDIKSGKTKDMVKILQKLNVDSALLVLDKRDGAIELSIRNIPNVTALTYDWLNVFDVLKHEYLIFTVPAVKAVQEVLK